MKIQIQGIRAVQEQLDRLKQKAVAAGPAIVKRVAEIGEEYAKEQVLEMGAYQSGELHSQIDHVADGNQGAVRSNANHSRFVEYGTGIMGKWDPHPIPKEGWVYDSHNHGLRGWNYYKWNRANWTLGLPHRPYMWYTYHHLHMNLNDISREVWGKL